MVYCSLCCRKKMFNNNKVFRQTIHSFFPCSSCHWKCFMIEEAHRSVFEPSGDSHPSLSQHHIFIFSLCSITISGDAHSVYCFLRIQNAACKTLNAPSRYMQGWRQSTFCATMKKEVKTTHTLLAFPIMSFNVLLWMEGKNWKLIRRNVISCLSQNQTLNAQKM